MSMIRQLTRTSRPALGTALAIALAAGFAGVGHLALADSVSVAARADRAVSKAERAVTARPQDPSLRVALGHAYLSAGRFESASQAFADAMQLGEASPATALSLALARIGAGQSHEAVALLDEWRDQIPAGDMGLALALAGETGRGVAILSDAVRGGDGTAKTRQNLAYAFALDGRWSEARVMAAQDVPADKLDARISDWAMKGRPEDFRARVASLLQAPLRADQGQPAAIALNPSAESAPQVASAPPAPAPQELRALDGTPGEPVAQVAEAPTPAPEPSPIATAVSRFAEAFTTPAPQSTQPGFVSDPVVQSVPATYREQAPVRAVAQRAAIVRPITAAVQSAGLPTDQCTHLVQLGSFASEANARRAWSQFSARNPELRNYRLTITPAVVKGRNFWRVAAAGLDARRAVGLCSAVKGRGGACFAYAAARPWPGAAPGGKINGSVPMKARRR